MNKEVKTTYKICTKFMLMLISIIIFDISTYSASIDINSLNAHMEIEVIKEKDTIGTYVDKTDDSKATNNKYNEKEINTYDTTGSYYKDEVSKDKYVDIKLSVKNNNPYEKVEVKIIPKVEKGFRDITRTDLSKFTLSPYENKDLDIRYEYRVNILTKQVDAFIISHEREKEEALKIKNLEERLKSTQIDEETRRVYLQQIETYKKQKQKDIVVLIVGCFIAVVFVTLLIIIIIKKLRANKEFYDDLSDDRFMSFMSVIVAISIMISAFYSSCAYAYQFIPNVDLMETLKETAYVNGIPYTFAYDIEYKYESKNKLTSYDTDTDTDGLVDALEYTYMTDYQNEDTDADGLSDYLEVMVLNYNPLSAYDTVERKYDAYKDYDNDGLTNIDELKQGTDLTNPDTDSDGLLDGEEVHTYTTNPLSIDTDYDTLTDYEEILLGLNPLESKSDGLIHDSERLIPQTLSSDKIPENLVNMQNDISINSISASVAGLFDNIVEIKEVNNVDNDLYMVNVFRIDCLNDNIVNIEMNVNDRIRDRINKLIVVQVLEDNELAPINTNFNDDTITCSVQSGVYTVVDIDMILNGTSIDLGAYIK